MELRAVRTAAGEGATVGSEGVEVRVHLSSTKRMRQSEERRVWDSRKVRCSNIKREVNDIKTERGAALHETSILKEEEVAKGEVAELGGGVNGLQDRGP